MLRISVVVSVGVLAVAGFGYWVTKKLRRKKDLDVMVETVGGFEAEFLGCPVSKKIGQEIRSCADIDRDTEAWKKLIDSKLSIPEKEDW